ncbi:MAG: glycosyltransferase [Methylacidiphilaceae bacterium]|nr:glycosyltransferase [Candidatus Methylacidiphilaceae bacterium]
MTIAIVSPASGEEERRLVEEARGQIWRKKEILVAGSGEAGSGGSGSEGVRRIPVGRGEDLRGALVRRARGAWIQWLQAGERLSPGKVESQLREARELSRADLLCFPYRLGVGEDAPVVDPGKEPVSYVARLGRDFPLVAPLLWSSRALRSFLREPERGFAGLRIGMGGEAGAACPGQESEPTRAEWSRVLAAALALACAAEAEGERPSLSAERERLFSLLEEIDPSLAGRASQTGELGAKAACYGKAAREGLRRVEAGFRRGRRRLLHRMGLRKKPESTRRQEPKWEAYANWVAAYQTLDAADREAIQREIDHFPRRPLLSVVMPVFNSPKKWLQRAIDSVQEQLYSEWELCIADDGSTAAHIRPLLEENRERDSRVRVVFREGSGGIAGASNSAFALARGEWIVLLDHDDELPEEALYLVAREILRDPEVRLLYSDEDKIDEEGRRFSPYFKPDFSPDLLLSQNCINHLGVYQAELFRSLGGFRSGFDGSQDYDLALRFVEKLKPRQIRHIPRVLYHWRAIASSGAAREEAKPYAYEAARRAIRDHLERQGERAEVLPTRIPWGHRVRRSLPENLCVSLVLGVGGDPVGLRKAIEALRSGPARLEPELLVVGWPGEQGAEGVRFLAPPEELTGPSLWNWAARQAKGEVLVLLKAPAEPKGEGWLAELVSQAARSEVGAVGPRLLAPDGAVAEAGVVIGLDGSAEAAFQGWRSESIGYFGQAIQIRNPSAVSAGCLATRRAVWEECGGFDEGYERDLWEIDYCLRLREKGHRTVFTPYAELVREESRRELLACDRERFRERWREVIERDPAYNPNLSLEQGYALAWPPRIGRPWRG